MIHGFPCNGGPIDQSLANKLLAALPVTDRRRLLDDAQLVELEAQRALGASGQALAHAYFPTDGLISLLLPMTDSRTIEVGMIGPEGVLGAGCTLAAPTSAFDAVVRYDGYAWQIDAHALAGHARRCEILNCLLIGYLHVQVAQCGRQAGCCRFHSIWQRLCRWLLMSQDRLQSNHLLVTHEFVAHILGIRRAGVSQAAAAMQERGLISYSRGQILILDRAGLLTGVCTCYTQDLATYRMAMTGIF